MRYVTSLLLMLGVFSTTATLATERPAKVAEWAWQHLADSPQAEVLVIFNERADLESATVGITDRIARRRAVVAALRRTAARSQRGLVELLDRRRIAYRSFSVVNALLIEADRTLVQEIAERPEIDRIVGNPKIPLDRPTPSTESRPKIQATEWGLDRIRAPEVWGLGFDGTGIVVGSQDTGIRWTHEAVKEHYRGWDGATADHDYNWHDAIHSNADPANICGFDAIEPCDDFGHGTHTVGTAAGGTVDNTIGVAPGAKWIGCRNMDDGDGTPAQYIECFDFFLAPWPVGTGPASGDPAMAPDVTVNSWSCPPAEGCTPFILEMAVDAQRAAGIFTSVSAQNSGPSCGSIRDPPAIYASVFSVGASNINDRLARFSSRGPASDTGLMKPEVSAPGVSVRSATNADDTTYAAWNGTSMASPHVAGAVALLWQAVPALRGDIPRTEELLERTARPLRNDVEACGGDYAFGPNNSWGYGVIDIFQAIDHVNSPVTETNCTDGIDNDGDQFTDCADPDCLLDPACPEAGNCLDLVDNDNDGKTDCADTDCIGDPLCPETGNCTDGLDNDQDGDTDCADLDCYTDRACPGLAQSQLMTWLPGLDPPLADLYAASCSFPNWLICPETITPGTLPGRLFGEASPTPGITLRLYQHSDSAPLILATEGVDLLVAHP